MVCIVVALSVPLGLFLKQKNDEDKPHKPGEHDNPPSLGDPIRDTQLLRTLKTVPVLAMITWHETVLP